MKAQIKIQADKQIGTINPDVYGHFEELAYRCFYGGFWAEMLKVRKFEGDDGEGKQYGVIRPWYPIGRTENTHFMHDNTIYYCGKQSQKIISWENKNHKTGIAQGNLYFEKNKGYEIRINLKQIDIQNPIIFTLEGENSTYATHEVSLSDTDWTILSFKLTPSNTDHNGKLKITFVGKGTLWLGTVSMMPEDHISGYRRDVIEAVKKIKPPNMRWPGGNFVSYYHWEDGIGDRDKRPPKPNTAYSGAKGEEWESNQPWEPNDVGIDEFLELCRLTGAKPYMAVNAGDGTPEEAANLVEYCNGPNNSKYGKKRADNGHPEPYRIELWGIGNEMFGNWQGGHVDEETYARRHLAIAKAMRAVDPKIKLVASGGRYWFYPKWNQAFFSIAKGYFDYIALHSYAKKYRTHMKKEDLNDPDFREEFYYYIVSSPYGIEEQIELTAREIHKSLPNNPEVSVAYDEWNCWAYKAPRHEVDFALRDGLYTAGVFHAFRRQCNSLTLANFSMTVNCLPMIRVNRSGLFLNPQYHIFDMYMNHQGPNLVESQIECKTFEAPEYEKGRTQAIRQIPYLDISSTMSENGEILYLGIINLHIKNAIETEIIINGWKLQSKGKMIWLNGEDYMSENNFEEPDNVTIMDKKIDIPETAMRYNFPPHSVTILEFYKK
jgi:alpha-N-arabinofuranosidase